MKLHPLQQMVMDALVPLAAEDSIPRAVQLQETVIALVDALRQYTEWEANRAS